MLHFPSSSSLCEICDARRRTRGLRLCARSYAGILKAFEAKGDAEGATALLEEMKQKGISPDLVRTTHRISAPAMRDARQTPLTHLSPTSSHQLGQLEVARPLQL
eukprot:1405718-Pleurochrysis_carterae.AAC.2